MAATVVAGCGNSAPDTQVHRFGFERIVSFDVVRNDGRIHLLVAGVSEGRTRLRYTHSADGGRHWAPPVPVGVGAASPQNLGHGNDVQIAAAGARLVAVWPTAGEGWGGTGPLVSAVSRDGGQHWQPGPRPARGFAGGQGYAAIKADAGDVFHLVWLDSRNGEQALYYARSKNGGQHWSGPVNVDEATCFCCSNEIALPPGDAVLVLYRDADPRDMVLAQRTDAGKWQRRAPAGDFNWHFEGCPHVGGKLAVASGRLHALVWTGKPGAAGVYHLISHNQGRSWSAPQRLAGARSHHIALSARGEDKLAAAWKASGHGDAHAGVVVAVSQDGGEHWSQSDHVFANSAHPRLVPTESGWLLIMRHDHRGLAFASL